METNHKQFPVTRDDKSNLINGGNCSIFDINDELKIAFKDDKEIQERILMSIKPDLLKQKNANMPKMELRYSVLKVTNKIAKMGKDPKWVYNQFDKDGNGTLDADEILLGIRTVLGIYFSKEETREFTDHLDEDKSGDIDRHEFC